MKGSRASGQKWMCKSCEFGESRIYDEVNASSLQFKCDHCGRNLVEFVETNKLNEEEEKKCREAMKNLQKKLTQFDNYIVPANFFGPGHLSAYVGLITTQQVEDTANVNFVVEPCNEFLGLVRKQRLPPKLADVDFEEIKRTMGPEINYFYQLEIRKRKKIN